MLKKMWMVWRHHLPRGDEEQHVTNQLPRSPGCCSGSDCQAHAQPYAAPQVPPPAGEKEKNGGHLSQSVLLHAWRQDNKMADFPVSTVTARRMHAQRHTASQVPQRDLKTKWQLSFKICWFFQSTGPSASRAANIQRCAKWRSTAFYLYLYLWHNMSTTSLTFKKRVGP